MLHECSHSRFVYLLNYKIRGINGFQDFKTQDFSCSSKHKR